MSCPTLRPCALPAYPSKSPCEAGHIHCVNCLGVISRDREVSKLNSINHKDYIPDSEIIQQEYDTFVVESSYEDFQKEDYETTKKRNELCGYINKRFDNSYIPMGTPERLQIEHEFWDKYYAVKKNSEIVDWLLDNAEKRREEEARITEATKSSAERTDEIFIKMGIPPVRAR